MLLYLWGTGSNEKKSANQHLLWNNVRLDTIHFQITKLEGMSQTSLSALQEELAVKIKNTWNGSTLDYAWKRLLLIYFKGTLAPKREMNCKNIVTKKSEEAADKKKEKGSRPSRQCNWQRIRVEKRHQRKCLERIESADDPSYPSVADFLY